MAKASAVLWKHKTSPDGRHPVWLRFTDTHQTLYLSLRVSVAPRFWNPKDRARPVRKGHPHADEINELVSARLAAVESARLRLLRAGEPETAEALKAALTVRVREADPCFLQHVEDFLVGVERAGNVARVDKERGVVVKLRAWRAGVPSGLEFRRLDAAARAAAERKAAAVRLPFSKLTAPLLRAFEAHLTGDLGNVGSTVQGNMNIVRLHVRRAIREGVVGRDADPFVSYTPPRAVRVERARLTVAEIERIEALDLGERGPAGPLASRVRDAFLLALYAAGVRFGDLARLRVRDVQPDGRPAEAGGGGLRLAYTAGKTGKRTSAPLVAPAARLVAPYLLRPDGTPKGPADYLLPILDGAPDETRGAVRKPYDLSTPRGMDRAVASQNALHNKALKRIGTAAGVRSSLSMHVARHSFADLARRDGWSVYDIKQALRHSSVAVTEGYLAGFDSEALDAQTRALFGDDAGAAPRDAPHDGGPTGA